MSNGKDKVAFQQPGQALEPSGTDPAQEAETPTESDFVTRAQARAWAEEAGQEAFRRAQKLVDQRDSRITEKVQAALKETQGMIKTMRDQGIEISAEKAKALEDDAMKKVYLDEEGSDGIDPVESGVGVTPPDPVSAIAWGMMEEAGIEITDEDPEAANLDPSNQLAWLTSLEKAIEAKRARLGGTTQALEEQPPGPGRLPTGAGVLGQRTAPDFLSMSNEEHWAEVKKSMRK